MGSRLAPLTNDRPKVLVEVAGRSFLLRQLDALAAAGVRDVVVVGGYRIDALRAALSGRGVTIVMNEHFSDWNNFYSVSCAREALAGDDFLQLDGDTILDDKLLPRLAAAPGDVCLAVDRRDELDDETMKVRLDADGRIAAISKQLPPRECAGEYIGVTKVSAAASEAYFAELALFPGLGLTNEYYEGAFDRLMQRGALGFECVDVHDCTVTEIDDLADLARAEQMFRA
jgi:choline kinase